MKPEEAKPETKKTNMEGNSRMHASSRRSFLKTAALGTAAVALAGHASAVVGRRKPNLLFINVDQMSHFAVPAFGGTRVKTPNLERLMARGTTFEQTYCADPVCCPSRACWFTGRAPTENGVLYNDNRCQLRKDLPDLGAWLRGQAGYETFHVGKWHVTGRDVEDSYTVLHPGSVDGEHTDMAIAQACEGVLKNRGAGGSPFLLVAGLMNPHDICAFSGVNAAWPKEFPYPIIEDQLPPLPANFQFDAREPEFFRTFVRNGQQLHAQKWSDQIWRYYIWCYERQAEMVDAALGQILDALESSAHADNTIVVFTADHGDAMASHRLSAKVNLYEQATRVPLIVSWPGQVAAGKIDRTHAASGFDLVPTLCDYAGITPPLDQRGFSLRPVLERNNQPWRDYVVSHSLVAGRMVRSARYKYITYQGSPTEQLFDLGNDPGETRNLAAESSGTSVLNDHRRMLAEWESRLKPMAEPPGGWLKQISLIQVMDKVNARSKGNAGKNAAKAQQNNQKETAP